MTVYFIFFCVSFNLEKRKLVFDDDTDTEESSSSDSPSTTSQHLQTILNQKYKKEIIKKQTPQGVDYEYVKKVPIPIEIIRGRFLEV
jgi:hypothetical protein